MFDLALGFVVGIVVGHFFPVVYTSIMNFVKSKQATVIAAVDSAATPAAPAAPVVAPVAKDVITK